MANRLRDSTSPYLLQHQDNPVDWYEWGPEAFARARELDRPIFLSVGYAACHWCHVMAHESFEDGATAELINQDFVAIKVDREERPDVDTVYMEATQALTGQGGWPMSVFLTPDRQPFYAGTYFPPTPHHGLPAFRQVLEAIGSAWTDRREEVLESASSIVGQLADRRTQARPAVLSAADVAVSVEALRRDFDPVHAGFGVAPKFPPSMVLEALLRVQGDAAAGMVGRTCEAMARGGIYDQLGGGFARYSVDAGWVVPHFEKMLYDNALLLGVYTHWFRRTGVPLAARVVEESVAWLFREMRTDEGAFAASLDADSLDPQGHLHEGAFYAWTPGQLSSALGEQAAGWAAETFGVSDAGTFEHGSSTLQLRSEVDRDRLADVRARLFAAREQHRSRPSRDDKVVAAWNGWLIDSLVQGAMVFDRPEWLDAAETAADAVWRVHWRDGRLRRASRGGTPGAAPAILEDYGALAQAYVRLAAARSGSTEGGRPPSDPPPHISLRWAERAQLLLDVVLDQFDDGEDGFFDTAADAEQLYVRPQDPTDNATPSGLSCALHALQLASELTGADRYRERAERAARRSGALAARAPRFAGWLLADAITRTPDHEPVQVAIVGADDEARAELVRTAWRRAPAGSVIVAGEPDQPGWALLADRPSLGGAATAYVCRGFVCKLPVTSVNGLVGQLG